VWVLTANLTSDINAGTGHKTSGSGPVCGNGVSSCFLSFLYIRIAFNESIAMST
jgi:hypothetical protein